MGLTAATHGADGRLHRTRLMCNLALVPDRPPQVDALAQSPISTLPFMACQIDAYLCGGRRHRKAQLAWFCIIAISIVIVESVLFW
jgi:hypothetical protein